MMPDLRLPMTPRDADRPRTHFVGGFVGGLPPTPLLRLPRRCAADWQKLSVFAAISAS